MEKIKWVSNQMPKTEDKNIKIMALSEVTKAKTFHQSFPQYTKTPLAKLDHMAELLGLAKIYVKNESYRFGLNAFKVLGSSFAMAQYIAKKTGRDISDLSYEILTSERIRKEFGQATFFTATDGNHGRGVAWAADKLGQKSVVYMPKGTSQTRLNNVLKEHATATIEDFNYDECVRKAVASAAETENGVVIQDTAWEGYEEIPSWIMQGYGTMVSEADDQFIASADSYPTHVFIQAGVGSLAGAVTGYFVNRYPNNPPKIIIVESDAADCIFDSAKATDGQIHKIEGDMNTIMAGLACGEPNTLSWDILRNHVSVFTSVPDWVTAKGMRMLSAPLRNDPRIISGESGAVTFGLLACIMQMEELEDLRNELKLNKESRVLLFSTEGDTDPDKYHEIVWDGFNG